MGQTVTADITAYHIRVSALDEGYNDRIIEIFAEVSDSSGNVIGEMETDFIEITRNLPMALLKVYQISRQLDKGTLVPELDF